MVQANIGKDLSGRIVVSFPHDPSIVTKIKTIEGRRWHPPEKHWSFPNTDSILEKVLKVFGDEVTLTKFEFRSPGSRYTTWGTRY